jgi:cysteine synthase A
VALERSEPSQVDEALLRDFRSQILTKVPHLEKDGTRVVVANSTPLVDLTGDLLACAKDEFGLILSASGVQVFGKLDSGIMGGSVKVRPAVQIIGDAIASGKLKRGQTVFEATSGNFGIALSLFGKLGLNVIVLVSRKLQEGVLAELETSGVKLVNLDVDICPAPGVEMDQSVAVAKGVAANLRQQLSGLGLDTSPYDRSILQVEALLVRQDVINLAKLLANIYGGFCPEQYDSALNAEAHEKVTGPEIDGQLRAIGTDLGDFGVVTAFGTGGTSLGLGNYIQKTYSRKAIHVVFPPAEQDVAGIRTKEKALGLALYDPERYAGEHQVDFGQAKKVLRYFVTNGYDIGESSALALYACIQFLNFGVGKRFVVILADGASKYLRSGEEEPKLKRQLQVNLDHAASKIRDYANVIWTHTMLIPTDSGLELLATSLGIPKDKLKVAKARDVQQLISSQKVPEGLRPLLPKSGERTLVVCMVGGTSLHVAEVLEREGVEAQSLNGGIVGVSTKSGKQPQGLVQMARE